jgi:hypothetical protein
MSIINKLNIPNICVLILEPTLPSIFCSRPKNQSLSDHFFILIHLSSQEFHSFQSISQKLMLSDNKIILNRIFRHEDPVIQSLLPHISYYYQ